MPEQDQLVRTACPAHDGGACGLLAHIRDGKVVKVEPGAFPDGRVNRICLKGIALPRLVHHPDRLKHPLKRAGARGEGRWQTISWDDALGEIAARLKETADKYGPQAVAWVLGGPGTGTVKFGAYTRMAALTHGTRISCWGYGDAGLPCGSIATFGSHFPRNLFEFPSGTKLNVVWGSNPGEANPFHMRPLLDEKEQGVKLVVIDPVFTVTASKADEYIGLRPGTDAALALAVMNIIFQRGLQDEAFIRRCTAGPFLVRRDNGLYLRDRDIRPGGSDDYLVGDSERGMPSRAGETGSSALTGDYLAGGISCTPSFQLLKDLTAGYSPETAAAICEVPVETIRRFALAYASAKPASIHTHNGVARTFHGDISTRAMGALAAVTGNVAMPGPSGRTRPAVLNWEPFLNPRPGQPGYSRMGVLSMYDAIEHGRPYPIRAAWFAFINFVNQCANSNRIVNNLFPKLDFIVVADMFMTGTAQYADIVLPVCSQMEHSDLIPGPGAYVQLQQKVIEPLYESRSDVAIMTGLAQRLGLGEYYGRTEEGFIDLLLDSSDPGVKGITTEVLKHGPARVRGGSGGEAELPARFRTPSGRIEFYVERLKDFGQGLPDFREARESKKSPAAAKYPLVFVQVHSRFRTHSMFGNVPAVLEFNPEPVLEIGPADAKARDIAGGDMVVVFNDRGRVKLKAVINAGIHPGVVNIRQGWWSEQFAEGSFNALTSDAVNPVQEALYEPNMPMNDALVEVRKA